MSNNKIRKICDQITALENELSTAVEEQRGRLRYQLKGKRVVFEREAEEVHQLAKLGVLRWFMTVRPQNYFTMPIIYGLAIPLLFLDLCISLYQLTCFPVYRISKVRRADYLVLDHQHLAYLNIIEKCTACIAHMLSGCSPTHAKSRHAPKNIFARSSMHAKSSTHIRAMNVFWIMVRQITSKENSKKFAPSLPRKRGKQANGKMAARKMKVTQLGNFTFTKRENDLRQR